MVLGTIYSHVKRAGVNKRSSQRKIDRYWGKQRTNYHGFYGQKLAAPISMGDSSFVSAGVVIKVNNKIPRSVKNKSVKYSETYQQIQTAEPGVRSMAVLCTLGTTKQSLMSVANTVDIGAEPDVGKTAYRILSVDTVNPGGDLYPARADPAQGKNFLSYCGITCHLVNHSNSDAVVELFWVMSKTNLNSFADVIFDKLALLAGADLAAWAQPAAGEFTGATVGSITEGNIAYDPFSIPGFKQHYKLLNHTRFNMAAGQNIEKYFGLKYNKMIDISKYLSLNPSMTATESSWTTGNMTVAFPRGTIQCIVTTRGVACIDETGTKRVTTSGTQIGFIWQKNHIFRNVEGSIRNQLQPVTAFSQLPYDTADANVKLVNIVDAEAAQFRT